MKVVLERNLDFKQFQNLIILTFCCVMVLLVMLNSLQLGSYVYGKVALFLFIILFFALLLTRKGLYIKNNNLYTAIFLFGLVLKGELLQTAEHDGLSVREGKLSTSYNYSYRRRGLNNWEPNLNYSVACFTINMTDENGDFKKKIIRLTKPEKVKIAIDFIIENLSLKYN
jgi:hypothetical protein